MKYSYFGHILAIFGHILAIQSQIWMWKSKLIFGLLNWYNLTIYQTQFTKPNISKQIYWTKFNLGDWTKYAKPNLLNQIDRTKCTKLKLEINPN